jgi:hypothetical protein
MIPHWPAFFILQLKPCPASFDVFFPIHSIDRPPIAGLTRLGLFFHQLRFDVSPMHVEIGVAN